MTGDRWSRRLPFLALVAVALAVLAGCGGGDDGDGDAAASSSTTPRSGPDIGKREAAAAIAAADFGEPATLDALGPLVTSRAGAAAAAEALADEPAGAERWAAVYVYVNAGEDPAPLRPYLADADPSVRVLAASGALTMGDLGGFEPLVELLASEDVLAGSTPPIRVWELAAVNLAALTRDDLGPAPDADPAARTAAQQAWRDWMASHRASLAFDPETATWEQG